MTFTWAPDFTQAGIYKFRVNATDDDTDASFENVVVTVNNVLPQITVTSPIALGGDTQSRSDPNHDTESLREVNMTGTINIQNSGPELMSNLEVASITFGSGFGSSDLKINYTFPKKTLAPGESISVPVSVRIPQKLDAVDSSLNLISPIVATLNFAATPSVSGGTVTAPSQITLKAKNNLQIKNVKVRFQGKSETVNDGDKVDKMRAGDNVEIEVEVENRFKDKEDVKIEDITVRAISDQEIDIDEDDDLGDLNADDTDIVTLSSVIDDTADDGTYDVEISADGTDEFGSRHGEKIKIRFEVTRESHEIDIQSISLIPSSVSCEETTTLSANIKNTGRRDEDDVYVRLSSPELSFGAVSDQLSLDKDDEESVHFNIPISENLKPGTYRITVDTYYSTGTKSLSDAAVLSVSKCGGTVTEPPAVTEPPKQTTPPVTVITVPSEPIKDDTPATTPDAPAKKSFLETPQYLALLVLGYVVVLGGGAALLLKLAKRQ
ncbi:MAG TPA: hypothetical protein VI934_03000, partial [Candidatus Nanoarchaeia archaeon]|nr:hypothetical protein [Candidatus Nanoarchaeia archaeon]